MRYPSIEEYKTALQNPQHYLFDSELGKCDIEKDDFGFPISWSGKTTITFHFINNNKHWAVRCFHREIPHLQKIISRICSFQLSALKKVSF
jgi:hypothetical protein